MAVSNLIYRIVFKAAQVRISEGEDIDEVIASYNKLSEEQAAQLKEELTPAPEPEEVVEETPEDEEVVVEEDPTEEEEEEVIDTVGEEELEEM